MTSYSRKPWIRFTLSLLTLTCLVVATGCAETPDEAWHCYDTKGHPAEGVLIVCRYGLANYDKVAVNHRFSDTTGKIILDLDKDHPDRGLSRAHACIYSPKLRNGDVGLGGRWHEGQPLPDRAVYFDEWNNKIYLKNGTSDPVIWHAALESLIATYSTLKWFPNGGAKLNAALSALVTRERAIFLEKYGEQVVPMEYLKTGSFQAYHNDSASWKNANLKFKDITLPLPKP